MTDNFEHQDHEGDFNEHELNGLNEQPRSGMVGNLAEAWRTRPLLKFMVLILAVFAVGIAAFSFLGGSNVSNDLAHLGRPPNLKEAPGGAVSPYMRQQTELANQERSDQAVASGGSALPTPIGQTTDVGGFGNAEKKDDPLNELRVETEQLKKEMQQQQVVQQQQIQQQQQQQQQQKPPEQFDNTLAEAMQRQMQQLLESWNPKGIKAVTVLSPEALKADDKLAAQNAALASGSSLTGPTVYAKAIVNAGTVNYAQLLTEANSDVPGPILASIVSGPLAGSRAVGSFEVSTGYAKYLVLKFNIADKKGTDYRINAYALDPDTTLGGLATEVDERYFVRVVLPAAAGFLQGLGQGLSQGNSSITTNGSTSISTYGSNGFHQGVYNGLGQAANTAGQFFQDQANLTKPLVRVAAGTPIGLFFVEPVYDPNDNGTIPGTSQTANGLNSPNGLNGPINNNGIGANGFGANGLGANGLGANGPGGYNNTNYNNAGGYPGTTVSGYGAQGAAPVPYPNYAQQPYHSLSTSQTGFGNAASPYGQ